MPNDEQSPAPDGLRKVRPGFILPSAAFTVPRKAIRWCGRVEKQPAVGDLVMGRVEYIGQHSSLENKEGRIHQVIDGTRAVFVLGNRYAPDYYEATIPDVLPTTIDLVARSGLIADAKAKNAMIKDPTRIKVMGYVCDEKGKPLNSRDFVSLQPKSTEKTKRRAKLILVVGTSMNSGKSVSAAACCWALATMGKTVRGSKVTGTASLKDILNMEDAGAGPVSDFTHLGWPATYMLEEADLLNIFDTLDLKYANNPSNYWVVELADGILQRETAMLLASPAVQGRIHRLIFSAYDAFGAIGGLRVLKERYGLTPDGISGVCSSSPLGIRELRAFTDIPIFNNVQRDLKQLAEILIDVG